MCAYPAGLTVLLALGTTFLAAGTSVAGEPDGFADVKRAAASKARSRVAEHRIEAIRQLQQYPRPEAAKLIIQVGLRFPNPAVRSAAREALAELSGNEAVCDFLLKTLGQEIRGTNVEVSCPLTLVLLACDSAEVQADLARLLDKQLAGSKAGQALVVAVAGELVGQGDAAAISALEKLTRLKFFAANFAFRRGIVQTFIAIRVPEAVDVLIGLLGNLRGEVRADIVGHLAALAGENHGPDAKAWGDWWNKSKAGFEFPEQVAAAPVGAKAQQGTPIYYGIPIYAKRMVFVIDVSSSMRGYALMAAKRELSKAIVALPEDAWFSIVVYNSRARAWQKRLVPAKPPIKRTALQFIGNLTAGGMTASFDALDAAFTFDAEAIYFLSDGAPSAGKIVAPAAIVNFVSNANRHRRISIYAIGIMPGAPNGPLVTFMQTLAKQNFGEYRQVDN